MGDFRAGLTDMWRSVLLFLPKALVFVAILIVGWIVARTARKLVNRALDRVGFDRAVQRGGIGRALARGDYDVSDILARLAYYGLLLLTLQLAFGVWGPNPVSDLITAVVAWLPKAFVAIIIVVVAAAIGGAVKDLITGALGGLSYGHMVAKLASWFIIGLGVIAALNQVGIATTVTTPVLIAALATVAGILIVGVGGGLVRPMAQRWDRWLDRAESESHLIKEQTKGYLAGRGAGRGDLDRELDRANDLTEPLPAVGQGPVPVVDQGSAPAVGQEPVSVGQGPVPAVGQGPVPDGDATTRLPDAEATQVLPRSAGAGTPPATPVAAGRAPRTGRTGRKRAEEPDAGLALLVDRDAPAGEQPHQPTPDAEPVPAASSPRRPATRGAGRKAAGTPAKGRRTAAGTSQPVPEPGTPGTAGGSPPSGTPSRTYESGNAGGGSTDDTRRIDSGPR